VTDQNAHPQASCRELVAVVHNGIIENYVALKKALAADGHRFKSETDTEVISHLIESEYKKLKDPLRATLAATKKLKGQYAIAVMFQDRPDLLVGARKDAPLIVGVGDGKMFLASDVLAFIEHTDIRYSWTTLRSWRYRKTGSKSSAGMGKKSGGSPRR
jgi:glucosamine--fructose-6-phosphate aminotransferase (isomerizing)